MSSNVLSSHVVLVRLVIFFASRGAALGERVGQRGQIRRRGRGDVPAGVRPPAARPAAEQTGRLRQWLVRVCLRRTSLRLRPRPQHIDPLVGLCLVSFAALSTIESGSTRLLSRNRTALEHFTHTCTLHIIATSPYCTPREDSVSFDSLLWHICSAF